MDGIHELKMRLLTSPLLVAAACLLRDRGWVLLSCIVLLRIYDDASPPFRQSHGIETIAKTERTKYRCIILLEHSYNRVIAPGQRRIRRDRNVLVLDDDIAVVVVVVLLLAERLRDEQRGHDQCHNGNRRAKQHDGNVSQQIRSRLKERRPRQGSQLACSNT